ncbi:MAG: hypothetical protein NUV48_14115 [Peptococcaceae bacterium]|nr:hypothetical protein [Peptococcaceae bacterium]
MGNCWVYFRRSSIGGRSAKVFPPVFIYTSHLYGDIPPPRAAVLEGPGILPGAAALGHRLAGDTLPAGVNSSLQEPYGGRDGAFAPDYQV